MAVMVMVMVMVMPGSEEHQEKTITDDQRMAQLGLPDSAARGDRQGLEGAVFAGEPQTVAQIDDRAGVIGEYADAVARPQW